MCGIVGAFPLNKPGLAMDAQTRRLVLLYLHNEVLFETVARGKDATGMALSFGPKEEGGKPYWAVLKQPVRTADFFTNDGTSTRYKGQDEEANVERYMDVACLLGRPLNHVLGHTRAKTKGSEFNPLNNHPIIVGDIIGIHNGGVKNDDIIYKRHPEMTPLGEVDSEAIMQLLALNSEGRPLGLEDIQFVTERIEGPRAVMAYNRYHPEQVIYFHDKDRPLELVYIPELATAILCSEKRFFDAALTLYERARLTIKRDLPELSWEWRKIPDGSGGVINIEEEVDDSLPIEEMFPLVECAKTLDEYLPPKTTTTGGTGSYSYHGHNASYAGGGTTGKRTTGFQGSNTTQPKQLGPAPQAAEIIDLSGFGPEGKSGQTQHVNANMVIDDNSDDDEDGIEDVEEDNVLDMYDDEELKHKGIEYALSEEAKADVHSILNVHKDNFQALLGQKSLTEDAASEIVHQLYPEMVGEGYVRGFKAGVEEQCAAHEEEADNVIEAVQGMEADLEQLKRKLEKAQERLKGASNLIANMKSFLLAAIITNNLADVHADADGLELVFDEEIEDFMDTAQGFENTDLRRVRNLFSDKDLQIIQEGFYCFAQKLSQEHEEESYEPTDAHTVKNFTQ